MSVIVITADVFAGLAQLEDESVQCVVFSPPYWGLRDYGFPGQIGMEPYLADHIDVLVKVMREVRRILKQDGTVWLNYGDCYATSPNGRSSEMVKQLGTDDRGFQDKPFSTVGPIYDPDGGSRGGGVRGANKGNANGVADGRIVAGGYLKPKDLCMVPSRLAMALQEDGWWVRSEIFWAKPNPMPESVKDRPAGAHEKIFLLTKNGSRPVIWRHGLSGKWVREKPDPDYIYTSPQGEKQRNHPSPDQEPEKWQRKNLWEAFDYYYDASAVRQPSTGNENANGFRGGSYVNGQPGGRQSVGNYKKPNGAMHSPHGQGFSRKKKSVDQQRKRGSTPRHEGHTQNETLDDYPRGYGRSLRNWEPSPIQVWEIATVPFKEAHFATFPPELVERCLLAGTRPGDHVLDPFGGAGTTGLVAAQMGRTATLIEANPDYVDIATGRLKARLIPVNGDATQVDPGPLFQNLEAAE